MIRPATTDDLAAIAELLDTASRELAERHGVAVQDDLILGIITIGIRHGEAVYVAESDQRLVGYVAWVGGLPGVPKGTVLGAGTYVRPEFRRMGISAELRDVALRHCREMGYARVRGEAAASNVAGIESCEKLGFRTVALLMEVEL